MSKIVRNATKEIVGKVIEIKKSILVTFSEDKDTAEITIDEKSRILVSNRNIKITVPITDNNISISGHRRLSDNKHIVFDTGVTKAEEIERAADIICRLD